MSQIGYLWRFIFICNVVNNVDSRKEESSLGFGTGIPWLTNHGRVVMQFYYNSESFKLLLQVTWSPFLHLHLCCHRYMKGRMTYGQLNAAVQSINTAVKSKYKILHQPVKTLNNVSRTLLQRFKDQETKDTKGITILSVCLFQSCWSKAYLTSFSTAVHHVLTVLSYRELRVYCLLQKTINATGAWTGISAPITKVIYPGLVFNKFLSAERGHPSTPSVSCRSVFRRGARHQRVRPAEGGQTVCGHVEHATPLPASEGSPRRRSHTLHPALRLRDAHISITSLWMESLCTKWYVCHGMNFSVYFINN